MSITEELQTAIDAYLQEVKNKKSTSLSIKQRNYENLAANQMKEAQSQKLQTQRDSYKAYADYINPYGIQREANASYGIGNSGLTQSNNTRAYSAYQNRLATAQSDYVNSIGDINSTLLTNSADLLSEEYQLQAEYLQDMMEKYNENYWKELNYNYKLDRDRIADERYEREWDYMLAKNAYSSSSSNRKSSSSTSKSSSSKYTHKSQSASASSAGSTSDKTMFDIIGMAESSSYANLADIANKATNNGTNAANQSTANQILNVGRNSNLSKEQLDALSKVLRGVRK